MSGPGRIQRKIIRLLEAEGFTEVQLFPALGAYRSMAVILDVCSWEGCAKTRGRKDLPDGMTAVFMCWDTMTKCCRCGIVVEQDRDGPGGSFDVSAKGPAP